MNLYTAPTDKLQVYVLSPNGIKTNVSIFPQPSLDTIEAFVKQGIGIIPGAPDVTFTLLQFCDMAVLFFQLGQKHMAVAAVSWAQRPQGDAMWQDLWGLMGVSDRETSAPTASPWAAIAFKPELTETHPQKVAAVHRFVAALAPALVCRVALHN